MKSTAKTPAPIQPTALSITSYADRPMEFWASMGPFFARREVRREMPYLVDDDGFVWFVARRGDVVVGFVSFEMVKAASKSPAASIHGLYVVPTERNQGIAEMLLSELVEAAAKAGAKSAKATASAKSVEIFKGRGFEEVTTKGQYTVVESTL